MFRQLAKFLVLISVVPIYAAAQEPAAISLPNYAVVPVEQDASWAVEWWRARHEEKREQAKNGGIDIVFIGDSITHNWENEGAEVWEEYYQKRNALNLGFGGDRTEHVLWRLENGAVDNINPSLVVVMIGTNNSGYRMDPAAYIAEGIERIVGDLRRRLPGAQILVLGIFPRHVSPFNEMRKRNDDVNRLISSLADGKTIHFLDIGRSFLKNDGTIREDLMPDLLHPNAAGYQVWAEAMEPTIKRLLRK